MFFELRQYTLWPGKQAAFVKLMDEVIIPFQTSVGMDIRGSWVAEEDETQFFWIRASCAATVEHVRSLLPEGRERITASTITASQLQGLGASGGDKIVLGAIERNYPLIHPNWVRGGAGASLRRRLRQRHVEERGRAANSCPT